LDPVGTVVVWTVVVVAVVVVVVVVGQRYHFALALVPAASPRAAIAARASVFQSLLIATVPLLALPRAGAEMS
jgi:hypothetical protein